MISRKMTENEQVIQTNKTLQERSMQQAGGQLFSEMLARTV
jgi:hypothetical protein